MTSPVGSGELLRRPATEQQSLVNRVKALAEALEGSDIGEIDLTENGRRISIRRGLDTVVVAAHAEHAVAQGAPVRVRRTLTRGSGAGAVASEPPAPDPTVAVVAPLTGVFYSAASPDADAFVTVGDTIQPGQSVCIVEAMKVFNEIKAEGGGTGNAMLA